MFCNTGKCCNALPGTVIDHTITRPDADEFFLQSHRVIRVCDFVVFHWLVGFSSISSLGNREDPRLRYASE